MNEYLVQWTSGVQPMWETTIHHPSDEMAQKAVLRWVENGYFPDGARVHLWRRPSGGDVALSSPVAYYEVTRLWRARPILRKV